VVDIKSAQTLTRNFKISANALYESEYERICTFLIKNINEKITFGASSGSNYIIINLHNKEYKMVIPIQYRINDYEDIYFDKLIKFIKKKYIKFTISITDYIDIYNKRHTNQLIEIMW
jgi:hypothetical protein